jgi:transcriptional regulator with XRE-family HTH domain
MVQGRKKDLKRRRLIARLRTEGLTFAQIGQRLGVTRQAVYHAHATPLGPTVERNRTELARRVKAQRMAAGISWRNLARQATVAYGTLRHAETGRSWPNRATFERLAKALGVAVAVLTGEEAMPRTAKPDGNGRL